MNVSAHLMNTAVAELRKTVTLPATRVALGLAVLGQLVISLLNAISVRSAVASGAPLPFTASSPVEVAFAAVPLGTAGAVILGVVVISSEYTTNSDDAGGGRQIVTALTATPRRLSILAGKTVTVALLMLAATVVSMPTSLAVAHAVIGDAAPVATGSGELVTRSVGTGIYWSLTALIALAITVLTRSGIVPLIVLIANSSLVSFSLLLSRLTPSARYLPDLAGIRLFAGGSPTAVDDALDPLVGGLVMAVWTAALLATATAVFVRRDA